MGFFGHNFTYGIFLQAIAVLHYIRRGSEIYWLWIILMGGGLGALVYIGVEVLPDLGYLRQSFKVFSHRKRIRQLEVLILDNPSAGNLEELGDLYLEQKKYAQAKQCYDRCISTRTDLRDPFYRRSLCELELGDYAAAAADLERVYKAEPNYDYQRAAGLLAHAWAKSGQADRAAHLFTAVVQTSTLSETQYNYAGFLAGQGNPAEARQWLDRILAKKATMPRYLKRRESPWFRRAKALKNKLQA